MGDKEGLFLVPDYKRPCFLSPGPDDAIMALVVERGNYRRAHRLHCLGTGKIFVRVYVSVMAVWSRSEESALA